MSDSDFFQRLSLDETLGRTFLVYKTGFAVFTKIAFLVVLIRSILQALMSLVTPQDPYDGDSWGSKHPLGWMVIAAIDLPLSVMVAAVGNIMLIRAVADVYLNRPANLQASFKVAAQRLCTIFGASLVGGFAIGLGLVLLVAPGLYLSVKWFAATPVIVIEGLGARDSLRRSWELTTGSWCYVFCTQTIFAVIVWVSVFVPAFLVGYGSAIQGTEPGVFTRMLLNLPAIFYEPLMAIAMTIMYINLRIEKEALNYDVFARDLGHACGDAAYTSLLVEEDEDAEIAAK